MLAKEAFDVLALRPGATPVEIKEAYRDLVKVWHPDRFGSDLRLRQKAEDKLKQLNEAYQTLRLEPEMGVTNAAESEEAGSSREDVSSAAQSVSSPIRGRRRTRSNRSWAGWGWLYGGVGVALGLLTGYTALTHGAKVGIRTLPDSAQQVSSAPSPKTMARIPVTKTSEALVEHNIHSAESSGRSILPKREGSQFHVRLLSSAETDQVESACSRMKESQPAAYQTCVKAQLDMITKAAGKPDLSALNGEELESIESVCSGAKRTHGEDGYNRCLTVQMAKLAADPARPDLSTLKEADRRSIEAACRNAKYREGPTAYNRCRAGLIKLLADSK